MTRCLKRAIAREVYRALTQPPPTDTTSTLAAHRKRHHLTQTDVAHALNTYPARISDIENHRRPLPQLTHRYHQYLTTLDTQQEHQASIAGRRGRASDPLYRARRTLRTGADLLSDTQARRLEALFADERHAAVQAAWGVYQRLIQAYRTNDPGLEST